MLFGCVVAHKLRGVKIGVHYIAPPMFCAQVHQLLMEELLQVIRSSI